MNKIDWVMGTSRKRARKVKKNVNIGQVTMW